MKRSYLMAILFFAAVAGADESAEQAGTGTQSGEKKVEAQKRSATQAYTLFTVEIPKQTAAEAAASANLGGGSTPSKCRAAQRGQ